MDSIFFPTCPAAILSKALRTLESVASEILICDLISSPTVAGFFPFPPEEGLPSLFFDPDPKLELDRRPRAFFILVAAVDVIDLCSDGDEGELEEGDRSTEELVGM
jgi:hypothetical protein